jgi:phosphoglycolate phosphatase-like HAD superfamily hydrolase
MHIFFDMDYTIVAYDGSLRPLTHQIFTYLKRDGHELYIWSGVGVRTTEVLKLGLADLTQGVFQKPVEKFETGLARYHIPVTPDVVVDDHKEVVSHFGGILVRPYFWPDANDRELARVYAAISDRPTHTAT